MEILGGALAWPGPAHTASGNRQDAPFFSKTKGSLGETNTHFNRYFTEKMSAFFRGYASIGATTYTSSTCDFCVS
jgi:hypothetical protein